MPTLASPGSRFPGRFLLYGAAFAAAIPAAALVRPAAAADRPPPEPFKFGVEREWLFLNQAQFRGSLEKIEKDRVLIRGTDGVVREFWPGQADGVAASYLQRAVCRLPDKPSAPRPAAGDGPLIRLAVADLPEGPLATWSNAGRLGGAFTAMNRPPVVRDIRGRKAVSFVHAPWLLPLEFQTMVSDFTMPEAAIDGAPLTVAAWIYNYGAPVDRETFLCWGGRDCGELDTPDFSFGCYEAAQWYNEKLAFPPQRFPGLERWRHLAFVLAPNDKDKNRRELKVYVDGAFVAGRTVQKPPAKVLAENLVFLGCAWEAWWGHAWATRPARPFTGAIADLEVYDRALGEEELKKLAGPSAAPPAAPSAGSGSPFPAADATAVPTIQERLAWTPDPEATAQTLHFGTDRAAVAAGKAATAKFKAQAGEAFVPVDLAMERLAPATTYHWRVESTYGGDRAASPGEVWSFATDDFDLEFDGPVSEAFPAGVPQDGFYSRFMEAGGYPTISPPGNHDVHLRAFCRTVRKLLDRRPDLVKALQSSNAACHLASKQHRGWGWSPFTCSCYGEGEAILREGAIVMHEMGHQFHMQGAEALEPDFRERLAAVFDAARRDRLWIGDYGGGNMWENVAVCASWWINDMTHDEGGTRPREVLRRNDPRIFHLLSEWWPGDTVIDLAPRAGVEADAAGAVAGWQNSGGAEYFKPNVGWRKYERTVGRFAAGKGRPRLVTAGGATAVAIGPDDRLTWNKYTWDALDGNRAWSVDAWVLLDDAGGGAAESRPFVEWRTKEAAGARIVLGGRRACEVPGATFDWKSPPKPGAWHHLAWVHTGGGAADGPGTLQLFVDGRLDASHATTKLALPKFGVVTVGGGVAGAIGRLRIHDYALHPLQVADLVAREAAGFAADGRHVAGRLLVDLDADVLAPPGDRETWPEYPPSLEKPWLRSWVNGGVLAGKVRNDAADEASRPRASDVAGHRAVEFDGTSRMIADVRAAAPAEGTLEAWVRPAAAQGTVLRWGRWTLPAKALKPDAWQHVAIVKGKDGASAWIDGKAATIATAADAGTAADRLVLGGERAAKGWTAGFRGAIAGVRVHSAALTEPQVRHNAAIRPAPSQPVKPRPVQVLVDLDAGDLSAGPVTAWKNRGAAGGGFAPAAERPLWRPLVHEVEGVKGVDFSGRKGLVSSFPVPDALRGGESFTVCVRGRYDDTRGLERDQTVASWGRRGGERAEFCWGSDAKRGAFIAGKAEVGYAGPFAETERFKHNSPLPGGWRHIAWAYDAAQKRLTVFVDGARNRDAEVALAIKPDERICLGGVRTGRLPDSPFAGLVAEFAIAGAALDDQAVAALAAGSPGAAKTPWLVRLDARDLPPGPLDAWANAGSLGGSFEPEEEKPVTAKAEQVASRAAVTFDGPATLVSDIPTPPALTGDVPFTVEMLVFNPKVGDVETVFALAPSVAMPSFLHESNSCGAAFGFGSAKEDERTYRPAFFTSGQSSRNVGWKPGGPAPTAGAWQHVACVNSGGYRGTFRVYVGGELVNERPFFTLDTIAGHPMYLGAGWNTSRGAQNRFTGSLARLRVHGGALGEQEIRAAAKAAAGP